MEVRPVRRELPRNAAALGNDRAALGQQIVALLVRDVAVAGALDAMGLGVRQVVTEMAGDAGLKSQN